MKMLAFRNCAELLGRCESPLVWGADVTQDDWGDVQA